VTTPSPNFVRLAARQLRRLVALTAVVAATAAFAKAPETMPALAQGEAARPVSYAVAVPAKASYRIAQDITLSDINGDGEADFANPTGKAPRGKDAYGSGHFGASRTGHIHEGVDYVAEAGQQVVAPIAGFVTKVGYAYRDSYDFRYIEITNRMTGYTARVMYVGPEVQVGQTLALGQPIGRAQSLTRRYPNGITNHVHLEIARLGGRQIDASRVIPVSA
jgi:murein DD-endopeptidase MepM/ murein hydrolase activator NlpD